MRDYPSAVTGLGFHLVFRLKDDRVIAPTSEVVAARAAAIQAVEGARAGDIGAALGLGARAVYRLSEREPPAAAVRAIRSQLGLRLARPPQASISEL